MATGQSGETSAETFHDIEVECDDTTQDKLHSTDSIQGSDYIAIFSRAVKQLCSLKGKNSLKSHIFSLNLVIWTNLIG